MTATKNRYLVAGNWKMNGQRAHLKEIDVLAEQVTAEVSTSVDVALCLPDTLVMAAAHMVVGSFLEIGGQNCHVEKTGAHTGDVSAPMLVDMGAKYIIVGHSERRDAYGESDSLVCEKAKAVLAAGAEPIICLGESLAQRESGETLRVVESQLANSVPEAVVPSKMVVAYEPIWAIGTGLTANVAQIEEVHNALRAALVARFGNEGQKIRLLYGGSMKAANAAEILAIANVDGGLVGGASLTADAFLPIIEAAKNS